MSVICQLNKLYPEDGTDCFWCGGDFNRDDWETLVLRWNWDHSVTIYLHEQCAIALAGNPSTPGRFDKGFLMDLIELLANPGNHAALGESGECRCADSRMWRPWTRK